MHKSFELRIRDRFHFKIGSREVSSMLDRYFYGNYYYVKFEEYTKNMRIAVTDLQENM